MLIDKLFTLDDVAITDEDDMYEDFQDHVDLKERLKKTLYFGKTPRMDRPSLPMTELAVEYFHEAVPRRLGQVDMYWASSISKKATISPCAMMLGMIYIDRLRHKNPEYIEKMSSEELFLISMMLASKYLYDEGVSEEVYNDEWADSANLDVEDVNEMEYEFLKAIDWNLYVSEDDFMESLNKVEESIALRQSKHNGFLTYSDFCVLLENENIMKLKWNLLKDLCKVFAICSVAYTASTFTMAGSIAAVDLLKAELQTLRPLVFDQLPLPLLVKHLGILQQPISGMHVSSIQSIPASNVHLAHLKTATKSTPQRDTSVPDTDPERNERYLVDKRQQMSSYSASQYLTLALFKDTLMAFVFGMTKDSGRDDVTSSSVSSPKNICHCPVCPLKVRRVSRRNKTCHDSMTQERDRPADTNWNHLISKLRCMKDHMKRSTFDASYTACGNLCEDKDDICCTETESVYKSWYTRFKMATNECHMSEGQRANISPCYIPASLHTVPVLA